MTTDWGWQFPPGVSQLPGESRAEQAYQRAYEDDAGWYAALVDALEKEAPDMPKGASNALAELSTDDLYAFCQWLYGPFVILTREEYAIRAAEHGYPGDDDREEPYE